MNYGPLLLRLHSRGGISSISSDGEGTQDMSLLVGVCDFYRQYCLELIKGRP